MKLRYFVAGLVLAISITAASGCSTKNGKLHPILSGDIDPGEIREVAIYPSDNGNGTE